MIRRPPTWAIALAAVAGLIAFNLVLRGLGELTREPGGPPSSAYATAPHGLAAYAALVARAGHRTLLLRERPSAARLDPGVTVVVLDARRLTPADARALRRFVLRGGRLVAGGVVMPTAWLAPLLGGGSPRTRRPGPQRAKPIAPLPELAGIRSVRSLGRAALEHSGAALPALAGERGVLLAVAAAGRGRVALLADASPLQNRLLAAADNAALGLGLAGAPSRPVLFVESVHLADTETGLAAIPTRWWWAFGGLALAALVFALARGRRLGPPEQPSRPLPPPRGAYVESLAAVLARSGQPAEALEPVSRDVRRALSALGVDPEAEPTGAAGALGVEEAELRAALQPTQEADVVVAGRVLARAARIGSRA